MKISRNKGQNQEMTNLEPMGHHKGGQARGLNWHQRQQESSPASAHQAALVSMEDAALWVVHTCDSSEAVFCLLPQHSFAKN